MKANFSFGHDVKGNETVVVPPCRTGRNVFRITIDPQIDLYSGGVNYNLSSTNFLTRGRDWWVYILLQN